MVGPVKNALPLLGERHLTPPPPAPPVTLASLPWISCTCTSCRRYCGRTTFASSLALAGVWRRICTISSRGDARPCRSRLPFCDGYSAPTLFFVPRGSDCSDCLIRYYWVIAYHIISFVFRHFFRPRKREHFFFFFYHFAPLTLDLWSFSRRFVGSLNHRSNAWRAGNNEHGSITMYTADALRVAFKSLQYGRNILLWRRVESNQRWGRYLTAIIILIHGAEPCMCVYLHNKSQELHFIILIERYAKRGISINLDCRRSSYGLCKASWWVNHERVVVPTTVI